MCGIAGYVTGGAPTVGPGRLLAMLRSIRHRGPDDEGLALFLPEAGTAVACTTEDSQHGVVTERPAATVLDMPHTVALGHRRFSILDLSPGGHQPFWSRDRQVAVVFNGEIYNYLELREELERLGHQFVTGSDTEVLVAAYVEWGTDCLRRCNGFFALALFDRRRGQLLLARDRLGKAPLYVAQRDGAVHFASEIKALRAAFGDHAFAVDARSLDDFLRNGRRDCDYRTFFLGIETLPAASFAWVTPGQALRPVQYWQLPTRRRTESELSPRDAAAELRALLDDAVRLRLRADVPIGVELSGGLDSSTVLATMAKLPHHGRLQVFTVSYPGSAFDEAHYAATVVSHLRDSVEQTVLTPPAGSVLDELDRFVVHMDEPFHNLQLVNHQEIWQRMRERGVRVSLSGAAADEVFAGYGSTYFEPYLTRLAQGGRPLRFLREFFGYTEHVHGSFGREYFRRLYHLLPDWLRLYRNPAMEVPHDLEPYRRPSDIEPVPAEPTDIDELLVYGIRQWPLNYYMRSGNQSSMGVPLEYRCPFLDYRIVEFGFSLPINYLIRNGWLKWILRQVADERLPREITWRRRKGGFRYPLGERLPNKRERLLHMVEDLDCPYIDTDRLARAYDDITARNPDYLWRLFSVALWWKRCIQSLPLERS